VIRVEAARPLDALPTLALHRKILAEGRFFVTRTDEFVRTLDQREREIAVLEAAPNSCFLVARLPETRVAGFLTANGGGLARTRHVARVELMVAAAWRRRGVGKALVEGVIAWAEQGEEIRKLSLTVLADNEPAIALYRACGFFEEGRRLREYREADGSWRDDILMAKTIG
jgi:ribosomal protein S18 acetylase RimI-like enzyme